MLRPWSTYIWKLLRLGSGVTWVHHCNRRCYATTLPCRLATAALSHEPVCFICECLLLSSDCSRLTPSALPAGPFIDDDRSEGEVEPDREEAHHAADDVSTELEDVASSGNKSLEWV